MSATAPPYPAQNQPPNYPAAGYPSDPNSAPPYPPYNAGYQDAPSGPPPPYPANYATTYGPSGEGVGGYTSAEPKPEEAEAPAVAFGGTPFSDKAIRRAFIRKVYLILMAQLAVTVAAICVFLFVHPVRFFVQRNPAVYYVSYATFLVTYIALACCPSVRRHYPGNFIALGVFTLAFSYMVATIASFYNNSSVLIAAGITCGICLAISLFATFTKIDFTLCTGLLFVLSVGLFLFGLSCVIVWRVQGGNYVLNAVYGGLAAVVFGLFLAYDTQVVLGGRRYELSEEEYIFGALQLYLDVVYLFLIVLSFFGNKN